MASPIKISMSGYGPPTTGFSKSLVFIGDRIKAQFGGDVSGMPNTTVRKDDKLSGFGPPANAKFALDTYPSPYLGGFLPVDPVRSTYVETVRGCRSHCTFCFYPRSSNVLRALDVEASADVVARLKAKGAREVVFLDPTFNHRPGFEELLDALARVNGDGALSFFAEVRAEGLTPGHAQKLARAQLFAGDQPAESRESADAQEPPHDRNRRG